MAALDKTLQKIESIKEVKSRSSSSLKSSNDATENSSDIQHDTSRELQVGDLGETSDVIDENHRRDVFHEKDPSENNDCSKPPVFIPTSEQIRSEDKDVFTSVMCRSTLIQDNKFSSLLKDRIFKKDIPTTSDGESCDINQTLKTEEIGLDTSWEISKVEPYLSQDIDLNQSSSSSRVEQDDEDEDLNLNSSGDNELNYLNAEETREDHGYASIETFELNGRIEEVSLFELHMKNARI